MASNIDPTKPLSIGHAGDLRANLAAAKSEIETLQDAVGKVNVWGGTASGTANTITLTPSPALDQYFDGLVVAFISSASNTGASEVTLNVNSLGQRPIRRSHLATDIPTQGEIAANRLVFVMYDSSISAFRLIGVSGNLGIWRSDGNPDVRIQARGDVVPEMVLNRIGGVSHTDRDYRIQINTGGALSIRDQTAAAQRVDLTTAGHWVPASDNVTGQLGTAARLWDIVNARTGHFQNGSANPSVRVNAIGDRFPLLVVERTAGGTMANRSWQINLDEAGSFVIRDQTGGANLATLKIDGKLELGAPVESARFIASVTGETLPGLELARTSGGTFTNRDWRVQINGVGSLAFRDETAGTLRLEIGTEGNVRPGTDNSQTLGTAGLRWQSVWSVNGTLQTSDEREKTEIEDSDLGLEFIEQLRPKSFRWKDGGPKHYGLIAQQMEAVLDGAEFGGLHVEDGRYSLAYNELFAPLISAVQTIAADRREMKSEIRDLSARLAKLEAQLAER